MIRALKKTLLGGAAVLATASAATAQVVLDATPVLQTQSLLRGDQTWSPSGPHDLIQVPGVNKFSTFSNDSADSVLNQPPRRAPEGGWRIPHAGPGNGAGNQGDEVVNFIDQPLDCSTGWFSNNNHNANPFLAFDDFRADGSPLRDVRFYAGVYLGSLSDISSIGIEIWTVNTGTGDLCEWTFGSFIGTQTFTLGDLDPNYVCTGDFFDTYEFNAKFDTPISLNPGQVYMITIYANMVDPNGSGLFTWNQSDTDLYNPATSWDQTTGDYIRCGPGMAFTTNTGSDCFEHDCQTTCFFSNFSSDTNPYIAIDDFVATSTGDLRQLQFTGGVFNNGTGTGELLGNISGFYIELYRSIDIDDPDFPCDHWQDLFYGAFQVSMADARPKFDCIDLFGIPQYEFTVNIPADVYPLIVGDEYQLGVYGVPVDPTVPELFCWGGTSQINGRNSYSFNLDTFTQDAPCHEVDQAFCVNGARPCLGDFNNDLNLNTIDVLEFLNAWAAALPAADINGDGSINTVDVIEFLNRWNQPC